MRILTCLAVAVAAALPLGASAQANDAAYCKTLSDLYERYVSNMGTGRSRGVTTIDGSLAVEQCKSGNTAAAIPVLERKLRDARIDVPARG
jgi:hypothetical protein